MSCYCTFRNLLSHSLLSHARSFNSTEENNITQNVNDLFCDNDTPNMIDYSSFQFMTELITDCAGITFCEYGIDLTNNNNNIVNHELIHGNPQLEKNYNEMLENCETSNSGVVRTIPAKVICDCCTECNGVYNG